MKNAENHKIATSAWTYFSNGRHDVNPELCGETYSKMVI
jgi:hypothetical protein